jgi:hydrogenase expression/formation protein HypE
MTVLPPHRYDRPVPFRPSSGMACPTNRVEHQQVTMAHGGGGRLSRDLVEQLFLPAFHNETLALLGDGALMPPLGPGQRIAFTTDSYVVQPLFFPGGSIGELAVNGTINDLAMCGAKPLFMSASFILEEGFPLERLADVVQRMADASEHAGVPIVTGDTKVVERARGDGCYINTSGIGAVAEDLCIGPHRGRPDDVVLVSGTLGDHGMAVMSRREGLQFESEIVSDTAPMHALVQAMLAACRQIRVLRDPTRGGAAAVLNEIAGASRCGIEIDEQAVPIAPAVQAACELLGLDPWLVANEGKLVAVVPPEAAPRVLEAMRAHPLGRSAARLGVLVRSHPGVVALRTPLGTRRILRMPVGEQLPRIC